MLAPDRSISGPHLARLLGGWRSARPGYVALAGALRLLVLDGRLPLRTRLPGERELASALGVSRTTTAAAYASLRDEGFLASRRGSGSWTSLPADRDAAPLPLGGLGGEEAAIDLSCAATSAPEGAVHAALAAATAELPRHLPGPGYDPLGLPVLRAAIAAHLGTRGVPTTPEQVLVTAGAQHALSLVVRMVAGPGDRVLVDHPTYPGALDAIRAAGARPVPVPLAPGGWDLDMHAATVRQAAPRLAYLIVDNHNPTGLSLQADQRERLVALARSARLPIVADETLAELALGPGAPPPRLATLDPEGETVIAIGSLSKDVWAGLRIGWIRASATLVRRLAQARATLDMSSPVIEQLVAAELLADPEAVLVPRRAALRERRDALAAALRATLPAWRFELPPGGLSIWAELDAPRSGPLAAVALQHGVRLAAGPRFGADGSFERFVRLPFSLPAPVLEDAVERIAVAWRAVADDGASGLAEPPALVA